MFIPFKICISCYELCLFSITVTDPNYNNTRGVANVNSTAFSAGSQIDQETLGGKIYYRLAAMLCAVYLLFR